MINWKMTAELAGKLTLRPRLTAACFLVVLATHATTLTLLYLHDMAQVQQLINEHNQRLARQLGNAVTTSLASPDRTRLAGQIGTLVSEEPSLLYAVVFGNHANRVYDHDPYSSGVTSPPPDQPQMTRHWNGLSIQQWALPLSQGGESLGHLVVGFNDSTLYQYRQETLRLVLCLAVLLLIQTLLLGKWLHKWVLKRVVALDQKTRAYMDDPVTWQSTDRTQEGDELERLQATLNTLIATLREREQQILLINAGLEQQVNDRTRDLAKTREEALKASQAKSEFLANMSHEIRTPLAAISGYSFLLAKTTLTASQQDYVARIDTATRSLLSILQDILDFSRIESGNMELYEVDFSLRDLCHKVIATIESEALKKSIDIVLELDESLPDRYKGDSLRLSQILVNLGSNAVKFTQRGKVMLNIAIDSMHDDVIRLRFSVRDTGIGLLPDQVDRLFQPFTQADASITRQYGGTGLGLAICQRLVSLMQGEIGLQSMAGVGSTFFFTIPLKPLRHDHLPARTGSGDGTDHPATADQPTRALQGYRLLLVEDHEINQMLLRELLEMEGATVDVASNGLEALARIRHPGKVFDAVLMDIQMPQMDGMEATRQIRKHPGGAGLPIIAMTAHTRNEDREACLAAGMNDYCGKPIDIPGLIRMLRHWVGQQAVPQTPPLPAMVAASDPAPPTTTVDFTLLKPVINVDEGLSRCHNDAARYGQLLKLFASGYRDFAAEARALHESGQKNRLNKAIHTLKGTAGNLGAESLLASVRPALAELEHPASLTAPVGLEALLADTDVLLQALQQWEAQLPPEPADDAGMAEDAADFSADTLFERFTRALAQNDLAAVPLWRRFRAGKPLQGDPDPLLNDIDHAVQRLDFPDALRKVNRWKHDNR